MIMRTHAETPSAHLEVIPAVEEQEPTVANLLELYAHDFSEFLGLELGADGRFGYKNFLLYWSEPNRQPFLVRMDGKLAWLVFVKRGSEISANDTAWDMAEFFVVRRYRRRGIGTEIAHKVWRQFPGRWEVRVMQSNHAAHHFSEQLSRYLEVRRSIQFESKKMERFGASSHSNLRIFMSVCLDIPCNTAVTQIPQQTMKQQLKSGCPTSWGRQRENC